MNTTSIIFLLIIVVIVLFRVRRWIAARSLKQYSARELQGEKENSPGRIFLDVRTMQERSHGAIHGSVHIPLHELGKKITDLNKYRDQEIICYCQSGSRSATAAIILRRQGFTVANLKGGISEWNFQKLHAA